jgi:hypothetical protein
MILRIKVIKAYKNNHGANQTIRDSYQFLREHLNARQCPAILKTSLATGSMFVQKSPEWLTA